MCRGTEAHTLHVKMTRGGVNFSHCSVIWENIRNVLSQTELPHFLCLVLAPLAFRTDMQQLQWCHLTQAALPNQDWFSCPFQSTSMTGQENAPTTARAQPAPNPRTDRTHCLQNTQTDAPVLSKWTHVGDRTLINCSKIAFSPESAECVPLV